MTASAIFRLILTMLAGVGALEAADKFLPGKAPQYERVSPGFKFPKILYFLGAMGIGAFLFKKVDSKFHIITRRHTRRRTKSKKR